jgi:hypothetical protein
VSSARSPDAEIPIRRVPGTSRRIRVYATEGDAELCRLLYWPTRRLAAISFGLGRAAHRLRMTPTDSIDLIELGVERLGEAVEQLVVVDTPRHLRRVVGLARSSRLVAVAKRGKPDGRLENEARMLPLARDRLGTALVVPELIHHRASATDATLLQRALAEVGGGEPIALEEGLAAAIALARADLTHDDLVPWNMIRTPTGMGLYDWEYARTGNRAGRDITHFVVQQGVLLRRWSPERCAELLMGPDGPGGAYADSLGIGGDALRSEALSYLADPPGSCERLAWTDGFRDAVAAAIRSGR